MSVYLLIYLRLSSYDVMKGLLRKTVSWMTNIQTQFLHQKKRRGCKHKGRAAAAAAAGDSPSFPPPPRQAPSATLTNSSSCSTFPRDFSFLASQSHKSLAIRNFCLVFEAINTPSCVSQELARNLQGHLGMCSAPLKIFVLTTFTRKKLLLTCINIILFPVQSIWSVPLLLSS